MERTTNPADGLQASWTPMLAIGMVQILMIFNISTLQVSIEGIVSTFNTSATTVGTAIVTYSLVVAGFIMPAAKIGQRFGSLRVFRAGVLAFGAAMAMMMASPGVTTMIIAQVIAGAAAAALVPTLVVLIAANYSGTQQAKALGWLGGAQAMGVVLAFLLAGSVATLLSWRFTFGVLVLLSGAIYKLSERLEPVAPQAIGRLDGAGIVLSASAMFLISIGCKNLTDWGVLVAGPSAPFSIWDMSPAPFMIIGGIFLLQAFFTWSHTREAAGEPSLVALEVVGTTQERAALACIFTIGALGSAILFMIPLYIQIVQGNTSLQTALIMIPFSLAAFATAVLVVRLHDRVSPRQLARYSFLLAAAAIALLGATIRNDWSTPVVIAGMLGAGLAEGALVTVLFNVLVTASPARLAADVGSLRGTTNNLASAVGTAAAATLVISILGTSVHRELVHNDLIPNELKAELNIDDVPFIGNDQLLATLATTSAAEEQVAEAVRINTEARLLALKVSFFSLAGFALLAFFPAGWLPARVRVPRPSAEPVTPAAPPQATSAVPLASTDSHG